MGTGTVLHRPQCHFIVTYHGWWLNLVITRWFGLLLMHLLFQKKPTS